MAEQTRHLRAWTLLAQPWKAVSFGETLNKADLIQHPDRSDIAVHMDQYLLNSHGDLSRGG